LTQHEVHYALSREEMDGEVLIDILEKNLMEDLAGDSCCLKEGNLFTEILSILKSTHFCSGVP